MKRYGATILTSKKTTTKKGAHKHLRTTLYDKIPLDDNDIWVITQYGDRLDLLANQFFNDPSLWWYIAKANNLKINKVPIGTLLRIPATTTYAKGR